MRFAEFQKTKKHLVPKEHDMDLFSALENRRSCRSFSAGPVGRDAVEQILAAAVQAPSPLNTQPWQFIVITSDEKKAEIFSEAERCRDWAIEKSGWKWLNNYKADFLREAPVLIAVVGDPKKTGVDMFQQDGLKTSLNSDHHIRSLFSIRNTVFLTDIFQRRTRLLF